MPGSPIENRAGYEKWNPANHVSEWSTPTLIIHSGKDYRLVDGEGIGMLSLSPIGSSLTVPSRIHCPSIVS